MTRLHRTAAFAALASVVGVSVAMYAQQGGAANLASTSGQS